MLHLLVIMTKVFILYQLQLVFLLVLHTLRSGLTSFALRPFSALTILFIVFKSKRRLGTQNCGLRRVDICKVISLSYFFIFKSEPTVDNLKEDSDEHF